MKKLTQEIFNGQPEKVDWVGVDYDGLLSFGRAINPRYTYGSERWRGFELVGNPIPESGYEPLTSIRREETEIQTGIAIRLFMLAKKSKFKDFLSEVNSRYSIAIKEVTP